MPSEEQKRLFRSLDWEGRLVEASTLSRRDALGSIERQDSAFAALLRERLGDTEQPDAQRWKAILDVASAIYLTKHVQTTDQEHAIRRVWGDSYSGS